MPANGDQLPSARLRALGIKLPEPPKPLGAYVPTVRAGHLLFLSGMLPLVDGKLAYTGRLGADLSAEDAREAVKIAALNALAVADHHLPGLDRVAGVVRLGVSLVTTEDFTDHASVCDGASELLAQVFADNPGHTRLIVGVYSLVHAAPLALEVIFQLREGGA